MRAPMVLVLMRSLRARALDSGPHRSVGGRLRQLRVYPARPRACWFWRRGENGWWPAFVRVPFALLPSTRAAGNVLFAAV